MSQTVSILCQIKSLITAWAVSAGTVGVAAIHADSTGSISAGKSKIKITNIGLTSGFVMETTLRPDESVELEAFMDWATKTYKKLPAVAYDATDTVFRIITEE